jgi:hypothetical protein
MYPTSQFSPTLRDSGGLGSPISSPPMSPPAKPLVSTNRHCSSHSRSSFLYHFSIHSPPLFHTSHHTTPCPHTHSTHIPHTHPILVQEKEIRHREFHRFCGPFLAPFYHKKIPRMFQSFLSTLLHFSTHPTHTFHTHSTHTFHTHIPHTHSTHTFHTLIPHTHSTHSSHFSPGKGDSPQGISQVLRSVFGSFLSQENTANVPVFSIHSPPLFHTSHTHIPHTFHTHIPHTHSTHTFHTLIPF